MASSRLHLPGQGRVVVEGLALDELERFYDELDVPGHKVELLNGRIVVSPAPSKVHSTIVYRLTRQLVPVTDEHGWTTHTYWGWYSAATRDRSIPDLMVAPPDVPTYDPSNAYGHGVLLVAEVVSPSSAVEDVKHKPHTYAQAGVPLFLRIDPEEGAGTVTLMSHPRGAVYDTVVSVQPPAPLELSQPFGITLDTDDLFR